MSNSTLAQTVKDLVGPEASPRPGQDALANDIDRAIDTDTHVVGIAPTGVGKSFALLAPAIESAARHGKRTVISTESLSLMNQVAEKDAPMVVEAARKVTGKSVSVAVLKGFGNYACGRATQGAQELLEGTTGGHVPVMGRQIPRVDLQRAVDWAKGLRGEDDGDRAHMPAAVSNDVWSMISTTSSLCPKDQCPLFEHCKPQQARRLAGQADVVITNHALLAVQAAAGIPAILGHPMVGDFDTIMVDEAHTLPAAVRSHGQSVLNPTEVVRLAKAASFALPRGSSDALGIQKSGTMYANSLCELLNSYARGKRDNRGELAWPIPDGGDPLGPAADALEGWAKRIKTTMESVKDPSLSASAKSVAARADQFVVSLKAVTKHRRTNARWLGEETPLGQGAPEVGLYVAPVDVAPLLRRNLWTAEMPIVDDDLAEAAKEVKELGAEEGEEDEAPRRELAVVAVSATLPTGFGFEAGLNARVTEYESPFVQAHNESCLYVAGVQGRDADEVFPGGRFSTQGHRGWAARQVVALSGANHHGTLVLAATGENGKFYAQALRAALPRRRILSQWDTGMTSREAVSAWRADPESIMVGTRSLMTGVDAKGDTCSLVIVDRIPRSPGNPVDDARVRSIMERTESPRWTADRFVYVSDAAQLMEQAAGRLIRSVDDRGMVAVLDPRMLKTAPKPYPDPVRAAYMRPVRRFGKVAVSSHQAMTFLMSRTQ